MLTTGNAKILAIRFAIAAPTQTHDCHHPRKRMIQYAVTSVKRHAAAYWMPAFAGHDGA